MINRVVLVGRLTKDPELKYTQSGIAVTRFTLAVNRPFRNQQGENEADFINCVAWRKQAENTANYLRKGSLAGVDGRIQTSSFEGRDGNRVFMTEVVADSVQFLEPRSATQERSRGGYSSNDSFQSNAPSDPFASNNQGSSYNQNQNQPNDPFAPTEQRTTTNDPFAPNKGGQIDVSDDDLPF